ncbi:MAG TPA: hypothetical protein H9867_01295 [Candidatus Corynebacterium gallistercoris]|uniref:Uncharacterized protein n=1 Tax=Candidatus Corynebacterium gallistercoris TaxID=2838530 RepID=A0A9D1UQL3_9CORY|nr:hypothetical protein [Candidatus Corynebacterium gallistercoris]
MLASCTIGDPSQPGGRPEESSSAAVERKPQPTLSETAPAASTNEGELGITVPAGTGVAIAGAGSAGLNGPAGSVPPWSTIKVPLSIAAVRGNDTLLPTMRTAITQSSNADAETLWAAMGDPATAGAATEAVIAEAGSRATVETTVVRPGFSSYGQSNWSVEQQAEFASGLRCVRGAAPVVEAMGQIAAGAGYGLGVVPGAIFKGGWGPDASGVYGVRQFGLVPRGDGSSVAVAVSAVSQDGSMEAAQQQLTQLVNGLVPKLAEFPAARC